MTAHVHVECLAPFAKHIRLAWTWRAVCEQQVLDMRVVIEIDARSRGEHNDHDLGCAALLNDASVGSARQWGLRRLWPSSIMIRVRP